MPRNLSLHLVAGAALLSGVAACAGSDTTLTSSETAALVESSQCSFQADRAAADACFQAFQACIAAEGADVTACRTTLQSCLPVPPPRGPGGHHGPGLGDGGLPPPPPGGEGGRPPPDGMGGCPGMGGDGGMGPPPGGRGGHRGPGGGGGLGPQPDPAAAQACHDILNECLATTPDANCFELEHQCMHDAFVAAFEALCTSTTCDATTDADCARLQQRCAEGVDGRPESFDGGACP